MATLDLAGIITRVCANLNDRVTRTKQDKLISGRNIKSINGTSLLGEGTLYLQPQISKGTATLSKGSGVSSYTGQLQYYGKVVQLNLNQIKLASALGSGSTSGTITTIPIGYRPTHQILVPWASSGAAYGYATISTGGVVTMRNCSSTSLATSATSTIAVTYIMG